MKRSLVPVGVLMILPIISCGVSSGQVFREGYHLYEKAGGWLKFHRLPEIWEQAHLTCRSEGAVLASPLTGELLQALRSLMVEHGVTSSPIFTGISDIFSNSEQEHVEGVSSSNIYTKTSETCVGLKANGSKVHISCFEYHPFACYLKKQDIKLTECGTPDPEYVMDNRTGSCYKIYQEQHNWDDASAICQEQGGHLAVINSQAEAEVIWELAKESTSEYAVSIGFRDRGILHRGWITVQGQSLEEAGYARWYSGEPNSLDENCGSVIFRGSKEDGILNDVSCTMDLMFICEIEPTKTTVSRLESQSLRRPLEPELPAAPEEIQFTNTAMQACACNAVPECDTLDTQYVLNNQTGSCYKLHTDEQEWSKAYSTCVSEGGHLAVINSQEEAEVIWDMAMNNTYSTFIGYRAFGNERIWITVQGQSLAEAGYEKWNTGEPSVPSANEQCGGLNGSVDHGILNDVWCDIKLRFICEIEPRASTYMGAQN